MKLLPRSYRYHFKTIDSTSSYLKREYKSLKNFTFVSSDYQTKGRGRNTRSWISDKNTNLLFSLLLKEEHLVNNFSSLSILSAISVIKVLERIGVQNLSLKWPNDVFVNDKKVSGILLEGISENGALDAIIIGIGINVNQTNFDEGLLVNPTSVNIELNKKINLKTFKGKIYKQLLKDITNFINGDNKYITLAKAYNYLKDKEVYVSINNERAKVKVLDINEDNSLKVLFNDKIHNLISDEVTFHL